MSLMSVYHHSLLTSDLNENQKEEGWFRPEGWDLQEYMTEHGRFGNCLCMNSTIFPFIAGPKIEIMSLTFKYLIPRMLQFTTCYMHYKVSRFPVSVRFLVKIRNTPQYCSHDKSVIASMRQAILYNL